MTTHSPQESREQFEKEVAKTTALIGWTLNSSQADADIMAALDTYTHSLITHAMQQIEAGKQVITKPLEMPRGFRIEDPNDIVEVAVNRIMDANHAAIDTTLTILQSLLPE